MMWWYGHGMGGWGLALMLIGNVLFWAVIIIGVIALIRYLARGDRAATAAGPCPTPEQLLAERFARGEIDEQVYRSRLDTLGREFRAGVKP
jgi:putative membrane protein